MIASDATRRVIKGTIKQVLLKQYKARYYRNSASRVRIGGLRRAMCADPMPIRTRDGREITYKNHVIKPN